jgi:hypothetical protein
MGYFCSVKQKCCSRKENDSLCLRKIPKCAIIYIDKKSAAKISSPRNKNKIKYNGRA